MAQPLGGDVKFQRANYLHPDPTPCSPDGRVSATQQGLAEARSTAGFLNRHSGTPLAFNLPAMIWCHFNNLTSEYATAPQRGEIMRIVGSTIPT